MGITDIKGDQYSLTVFIIQTQQRSEFFLPCGIPDIQCCLLSFRVGVRVSVEAGTQSGLDMLLEIISD